VVVAPFVTVDGMITLASKGIQVRADPAHGGEILDLIDLETGRQLLGRPPFGSDLPCAGDLDEEIWTRSYRGGWQTVLPNAGNRCIVGGSDHGFHGRASVDPWRLLSLDARSATLGWGGHGLEVTRTLSLSDDELTVRCEARAISDPAPMVAVEHISFGLELLHPEVVIELPAGLAYELDESDGPVSPPPFARHWPLVGTSDGGGDPHDRLSLDQPRGGFAVVAKLPEGRAVIRNEARGQAVELRWDVEWFPHVWLWHDVRAGGGIWRNTAEVLAVEPSTVPHSLGLERAVAEGQARWVARADPVTWWVTARPFRP
jgi:hypothetical protein